MMIIIIITTTTCNRQAGQQLSLVLCHIAELFVIGHLNNTILYCDIFSLLFHFIVKNMIQLSRNQRIFKLHRYSKIQILTSQKPVDIQMKIRDVQETTNYHKQPPICN